MKIRSLFSYPLHAHSLLFIALFSILITGSIFGSIFLNAWSIMGLVLFTIYALKYGYMVLDYTVNGHGEAPVLSFERINVFTDMRPVKQGLILAMLIKPGLMVEAALGQVAGMFFWFLLAAIMPACVIILAIENSLFKALNPLAWLSFISRLQWAYLAIYIPVALTAVIITGIVHFSIDIAMTVFGVIPAIAVILYFLVWDFHVIGMILYHNRFELGLQADHSPERKAEKAQQDMKKRNIKVLDRVYKLRRAGKKDQALAHLLTSTQKEPDQKSLHAWLHNEFKNWDNPTMLLLHGEYYICHSINNTDMRHAMSAWETCRRYDEAFCLTDEQSHWQLAQYALGLNQRRDALQLVAQLLDYAVKPDIQHAAANMALELCEQGFADKQAEQTLRAKIEKIQKNVRPRPAS